MCFKTIIDKIKIKVANAKLELHNKIKSYLYSIKKFERNFQKGVQNFQGLRISLGKIM